MKSLSFGARMAAIRSDVKKVLLLSFLAVLVFSGVACMRAEDYLQRGSKAFANGNYREATLNYQKAIQKDPQLAEAFRGLGACQVKAGDFVDGVANLEKALLLEPRSNPLRAELADAALSLYMVDPQRPRIRYDQVSKLSTELLRADPNSFDGLRFQASLLYTDGRIPEAIAIFQKANAIKPMEPAVILPLAEALRQNGQASEAESLATELARQHKDYLPIYDWLFTRYQATNRPAEAEKVLVSKVDNNPLDSNSILQLANYYRQANKLDAMTAALDRLTSRPKDFPNRFFLLGDFYAGYQNWGEAQRWFETGLKSDSKQSLEYRKRLVAVYLGQQRRQDALNLLDQMIKDNPEDWTLRAQRADLYIAGHNKQEVQKAVAECLDLVKTYPVQPKLRYLLGRAYLEQGRKDLAARAFTDAAAQGTSLIEPRLALAELDRQSGNFKEVLRLADEIAAIAPNNFEGKLLHASASRGLGNLDQAQRELDALARQAPQSQDVQLEIGLLTLARKQYAAAERVFDGLYQSNRSDTRALAALTESYLAQRQFDRAIQTVSAEMSRRPDSIELRELLAATALNAGKPDLALQQYQKLTQLAPDTPKYFISMADLFRVQRDYANELAALQKASQLSPEDSVVAGRLAIAQDLTGNKQQAGAEYKKSLDMAPTDPALLNNRAYFIAEDGGNLDEATAEAQAALRKLPNNPAILDTLAWIYTKRNQNDSAIQILGKLVQQNPNVAAFHYHFGVALAQKGDKSKAKSELQLALTKTPTAEEENHIKEYMGKLR